jgi:ubiquinone/menaquinone biosynthesis C-methylase UbiE/DNA-binding transcriptional ArsR family regulator
MPFSFESAVEVLRAAAEPTRLRLLALLMRGELTVGEISLIVRQSQPRVSRHLKLLCDAGLLDRLREQHWVYYRVPASGEGLQAVQRLLPLISEVDAQIARDRLRMKEVIAQRAKLTQTVQQVTKDNSDELDAALLNDLGPESLGAVLDIGTGSGHLLKLFAPRATRLVGIDLSSDALRIARTNVYDAGIAHCELQRGDMYDLPFGAPLFDTAIVDRVLARADRPTVALAEMVRVLKHGGRVVLIDDFDAIAAAGDGNPIANVREWFREAGLHCLLIHPVDTERGHLMIAVARNERISTSLAA